MNPESSVIDEIDRLVEESLARPYAERSGYDNDVNQPRCPHWDCRQEWHGIPTYRCPGSATLGPSRPGGELLSKAKTVAMEQNAVQRPYVYAGPPVGGQVSVMDSGGNVVATGRATDLQFSIHVTDEAVRAFAASVNQIREAFISMSRDLAEALGLWEIPVDPLDPSAWTHEPVVEETPQQRALPRPSATPPMWANDPTRNRRRRR